MDEHGRGVLRGVEGQGLGDFIARKIQHVPRQTQ